MATGIYNSYKTIVLSPAGLDLASVTLKVALVTSGYTPDFSTNQFYSDLTNEVVGAGYTAGGEALANVSVTEDDADNRGVLDADDLQWPGSTITARGAVIYVDTGVPGTSQLIGYIDFGSNRSSNGGTFTIQWQSTGILLAS